MIGEMEVDSMGSSNALNAGSGLGETALISRWTTPHTPLLAPPRVLTGAVLVPLGGCSRTVPWPVQTLEIFCILTQ